MTKQIFVNLPVKNLDAAKKFFAQLGFTFNPQFTDANAACLILGDNMFAMLLVEKFFKGFIPGKEIANADKSAEVITALSADSRKDVDAMIQRAEKAGGSEYRETVDLGWMYGRAFQDIDGHIWEILYMDEIKMPEEMKNKKR